MAKQPSIVVEWEKARRSEKLEYKSPMPQCMGHMDLFTILTFLDGGPCLHLRVLLKIHILVGGYHSKVNK